jgi:choline dehydrogenase-like flavoprotein
MKNGLGNDRDLVGRFFMEHPHVSFPARVLFVNGPASLATYQHYHDGGLHQMGLGVLVPTDAVMRSERLLNFCAQFDLTQKLTHPKSEFGLAVSGTARRFSSAAQGGTREPYLVPVFMRMEQVPNPNNRVSLLPNQRDKLGMPYPSLHWDLTEPDYDGFRRALDLVGREVGRSGLGRMQITHPTIDAPGIVSGGYHHMGTTRMNVDPKKGVCDADGRVHGIENLFMAGSSLFPTGGISNPTFTIAALAVRLADRLKLLVKKAA